MTQRPTRVATWILFPLIALACLSIAMWKAQVAVGHLLEILLGLIVGALFIFALWKIPQRQVSAYANLEPKDRAQLVNEYRKTLAQIFGGIAIVVGLYFTWRQNVYTQGQLEATTSQLRIASEGQITERWTKATIQLGDHNMDTRLGGIYALGRVCHDSGRDCWAIRPSFDGIRAEPFSSQAGSKRQSCRSNG